MTVQMLCPRAQAQGGLGSFSGITHLVAHPFTHMFPDPLPFLFIELFEFILQVPHRTGITSLRVLVSAQEICVLYKLKA